MSQLQPPAATDKLERLFAMQAELNDRIFAKKDLRDREGKTLTTATLMRQARGEGNAQASQPSTQGSGPALGPNTEVNEWLGKFLTALDDESRELREELLWKWWSKDTLNLQNIRVEIIDQLHFWMSLALTAGMDAHAVFDTYMQKNAVNHKRQEQDYSRTNKTEADNLQIRV